MRKRKIWMGVGALAAFVIWTAAVKLVDVQPIGPMGSAVGFAALNRYFHNLTGVNWFLYAVTDWLGLIPLALVAGFGLLGLYQWVKRKSLRKVDRSILVLGGFYGAVLAIFVLFEKLVINYRPVLIAGALEASYPSSTTMLVMCVMPTAMLQVQQRLRNRSARRWLLGAMAAFTALMVLGRLFSGVHWLTDILGGALLSTGLVILYRELAAGLVMA